MLSEILAVILTALGIAIIGFLLLKIKGMKIKFGSAGMVLIFMPYSLAIARSSGEDLVYNIILLAGTLIGLALFAIDIPKS